MNELNELEQELEGLKIEFEEMLAEDLTSSHAAAEHVVEGFLQHVKDDDTITGVICIALNKNEYDDLDVKFTCMANRSELSTAMGYLSRVVHRSWDEPEE